MEREIRGVVPQRSQARRQGFRRFVHELTEPTDWEKIRYFTDALRTMLSAFSVFKRILMSSVFAATISRRSTAMDFSPDMV
jgi:hypothetical protein